MSALSVRIIEEFCGLCDWAFQVWLNHREMFDDNPRAADLQKSMAADALARLSTISHEYSLLQIAKLHDPVVVSNNVTLGIQYIVKYGGWTPKVQATLAGLERELNQFAEGLRSVRNRVLSHNDLAAILSDAPLGAFNKDEDKRYFEMLQEFVNLVHEEVIGGPRPFDTSATNDVGAFMAAMGLSN